MNTELWKSLLFRECRQILADKTRMVFLFAPALLYVLVFGMLYFPNVVKEIPCIIYDADQSCSAVGWVSPSRTATASM